MGRIVAKADQEVMPSPLGDDPQRRATRLIAEGRNLQLALAANRDAIIDLALSVAERCIRRSVALSPEIITEIYESALKAASGLSGGTIRVHPDAPGRERLDGAAAAAGFQVIDDPSIDPPGCVLNSGAMQVDCRLETALAGFRKALRYGSSGE